ncbi:MAG: hypothetical protein A2010_03305 [Nitrospirae bacterium GWD2_57_9]|nr:MAG: hypothetical protein A2010_03305 [Nitrospirae bacterium GWD2_57_9]OGW48609.1 MAG: hypothetical protein A2078_08730 [Nitrospirae bacterium GWC2_57_9]
MRKSPAQRPIAKKKVLFTGPLTDLFVKENNFFERSDIILFTATTSDDILLIHREEKLDLIATLLDLPGIRSEELFSRIRAEPTLKEVSVIIICKDTLAQRERCKQCGANALFTIPVDTGLLQLKMQQLLAVAGRKNLRTVLAVGIQGRFRNRPMPFWTENISASGMLIRSEEPLQQGDGIFFSFFLPDGMHVSGYGEIARVVQVSRKPAVYHYGIKFTNIEPEARAAIEGTVRK